jgi:hypothetical protein
MKLVYYNGLGCLMKFPSCNGADAYDLAEITQYRGVFALPEYKVKELLFTEIVSIHYLELTQHKDSPDFSSELNTVRTESDLYLYQVSNFNRGAAFLDLVAKQLPKENRVALILTAVDCIEAVELNSEEQHYKTAWGNKLSILDATQAEEAIITSPQPEKYISKGLTLLNLAASKFWKNADPENKETHPKNAEVEKWLIKEGLPKTYAPQVATIIRPEWATKGRR